MDCGYMDSELPPKRNCNGWILFAFVILGYVLFVWRFNYANYNPPYEVASIWQCEDPRFSIAFSRDENGLLVVHEALEWNNETMLVDVCFFNGVRKYDVYPDSPSPYVYVRHEDRLFGGPWKYRRGGFGSYY